METTLIEFISTHAGAFGAGFSVGFGLCKLFCKKEITTTQINCYEPEKTMRHGYIHAKQIYANGKLKDISCDLKIKNNICKETGKKCIYL